MSLLLVGMFIFFIFNYRLLSLLEREDWPALAYYLEDKVFTKGRYTLRNVRILASSYLIISDYQSVLKLEARTTISKPSAVSKNVLIFGSARIISGKYAEAAVFFKTHQERCKPKERQWVRWFYGFSLLLAGDFRAVEPVFTSITVSSGDALITGLSAYFLYSSLEKKSASPDICRQTSDNGKIRVLKSIKNIYNWKRETDKLGTDIYIAIIRKYIDEAGKWLFD